LIIEPTEEWHTENGMLFRLWRTVDMDPPLTIYVAGCSIPVAALQQPNVDELIALCTPPGTTGSVRPE